MIKDAQYHPVTEQILHIDLLRVRRDEKMKISIPLVLEGNSAGVVQGGILTQTLSNIDIQCFPTYVPENIIVDITKLDLNSSITAGDLKLDEDITLETLPDTTIVACNEPKVELEPTVDEIADTDDGASVQEDSSSDVDSKETNSDENKKES